MKVAIDVREYSPKTGVILEWDPGFEISAQPSGKSVRIFANREGLTTLARHLLTLAQDGVPAGHHLHLDDSNGLEDGSIELILERA